MRAQHTHVHTTAREVDRTPRARRPAGAGAPIRRAARRDPVNRLPRAVQGEEGLFVVDATWGVIQPIELPGGVAPVGELEVIVHVRAGGQLVDTRQPEYVARGTLPGAVAVPHTEVAAKLVEPAAGAVILFCNGPQCTATPHAIASLLEAGWSASRLRYYRGGIHDWVTLGLPLVTARDAGMHGGGTRA